MDSRRHELVAVATVGGLGGLTFAIHGYHLLAHDLPPLGIVFGVAIPMVASIGLVAGAVWLEGAKFGEYSLRVAMWCLICSVVLFAVSAAVTAFQYSMGGQVEDAWYMMTAHVTVGGLLGTLLGVYDTQRFRTRRALETERETASLLGKRLSVLNRVLRHDLRNSVTVIQGNAEIIAGRTEDPVEYAEMIINEASEMVELSERAREVESVLSNDIEVQRFDLGNMVTRCVVELEDRNTDLTVHNSVETGAWVETSPLIETAIERLLENAVEHNDAAHATVWVDVSTLERNDGSVVSVRIADDGPGIPPEQVKVIERGRETALEHTNGLGLWHVDWIIEAAGGDLQFADRSPQGGVVEFTLPRVDPPETATTD